MDQRRRSCPPGWTSGDFSRFRFRRLCAKLPGVILAIESSCDESAVALFDPARGLLGEWVHTQIERHRPYGGVVPELASREHLVNLPILLDTAIRQLDGARPDTLAVTRGPGLAGCLALGLSSARALALAWERPLLGVNHLRGHAWSAFIESHRQAPADFAARLDAWLPHLGLIVSGGNTLLFELTRERTIRVLAETLDDAAGEALDKGAKLLGMAYPGGPLIEHAATGGDRTRHEFPRAFAREHGPRFSFSGLKTSLRYLVEKMDDATLAAELPHICASYQEAVVDALVGKVAVFLRERRFRSVGLSGGVANNKRLRELMAAAAARAKIPLFAALPRHTGDNAAMIAFAAWADPQGTVVLDGSGSAMDSLDPSARLA